MPSCLPEPEYPQKSFGTLQLSSAHETSYLGIAFLDFSEGFGLSRKGSQCLQEPPKRNADRWETMYKFGHQ